MQAGYAVFCTGRPRDVLYAKHDAAVRYVKYRATAGDTRHFMHDTGRVSPPPRNVDVKIVHALPSKVRVGTVINTKQTSNCGCGHRKKVRQANP